MKALAPEDGEGRRLIFVSTHLARNPESAEQGAIRLRQATELMVGLGRFADEHGCGGDVPAVVAGDWNAESFDEIKCVTTALVGLLGMKSDAHSLLYSASDVPTHRTSFTLLRQSRIDYLVYPDTLLRLKNVRRAAHDGASPIPNGEHPSDHLPIAADFQYSTDLEIREECARRFCVGLRRGSLSRPLLPDEMHAAFDYFDTDGSGTIEPEEFADGIRRLGIADTADDARSILDATFELRRERYGDGGLRPIPFSSFQWAFERRFESARLDAASNARDPFVASVVRAFGYFDVEGCGRVTRDALSRVLRSISPIRIDDCVLEGIFERVYLDVDGSVKLDAFVSSMLNATIQVGP